MRPRVVDRLDERDGGAAAMRTSISLATALSPKDVVFARVVVVVVRARRLREHDARRAA